MKKTWKKLICCVCVIMMFGLLTACGTTKRENVNEVEQPVGEITTEEITTEEVDEPIVITVLTDKTQLVDTKFAEYKAKFEAEQENVLVEFEAVLNYEEEMTKRLKSGDYGDVLLIPESVTNEQLVQYFEPLGTVVELGESYNELFLQGRTVDGVVYGLPRFVNVQGIAYNEVVLSKAGVIELPQTPGEFLSVLKKIQNTQPEVIPYYTGYQNGEWLWKWQTHVWGSVAGNADYRNNGIVTQQEPFAAETPNYIVHELLYDIVKNGLCEKFEEGENWRPIYRLMNRGDIGCMVLGSEYLHELQVAGVNPDDVSFMPFPYNIDGQQYASVELDYCYAVNKNSENKEVAKAWIEYMLKDSGFAKSEGAISIKKKGSLPDVLSNFEDVEFVVNNRATVSNEGKYEKLNELSGIYLDKDIEKNRLILSALGESEESFEDIMNDWNLRWRAALRGIRYASVKIEESGTSDGDLLQEDSSQEAPIVEMTPEYVQFLEDIQSSVKE
ncbi:MAG: extracellular solute-binding protein [Lachnospiraceae bacterium]|nr:extracellular solute-binding protein [Lachnospiraceae bacterium]